MGRVMGRARLASIPRGRTWLVVLGVLGAVAFGASGASASGVACAACSGTYTGSVVGADSERYARGDGHIRDVAQLDRDVDDPDRW